MVSFDEGLDKAVQGAFTRPIPKTAPAQMRYLVKQHKGSTGQVAALLGITQRTVERYVKGQIKKPRADLAERLAGEVTRRWQPKIRAQAKKKAASTDGLMIDTRATFGYTAAPGTTDEARLRHLTLALPPQYAARLFEAQDRGAGEERLRQIAAEGLGHAYFRDGGRRAHDLSVELRHIEHLEFEL
ncbi:helix-turn-helix transcriptional regulator [Streptomyces sp. ODS28]|uniref:telomere-protecting terminal protein Tpg n=1 Tax=Streptomyces sp. ODS28 TaxID=3136688 RepID=UPI0031EED089